MGESNRLSELLGERYRLLEEVGSGSTSVVFRARDLEHGHDVAVKLLRPELAATLTYERFFREINLAGSLSHPHIVPVIDSGGDGDLLYYTMPFVEGESLHERIASEGQLPVEEVLRIAREVGSALTYAHSLGVVHRDIKPANILLTPRGAMVVDFGLGKAVKQASEGRITESGLAVGTPAYMSPEQGSADPMVDERSDQYSLACVVHEMLAGDPPFTGRTGFAVIARHLREAPPSLEVVRPGIPSSVAIAVERALSKAPADRFEDIEQFVDTLADPTVTRPTPGRRLFSATRIALVAAAALAAVFAWMWFDNPPLNPNRIVGFPLEDRGTAPPGQGGPDLAIVIGAALAHAPPLKWYDGWKWMSGDLRETNGPIPPDSARRIARGLDARFYLSGTAQHGPDSVRVVVDLMDVRGDTLVRSESEVGAYSETTGAQVALRALNRLLPPLLGGEARNVDLSHLLDRDPGAIVAWSTGEGYYRDSRFADALSWYRAALDQDSMFALAALRGVQAAGWLADYEAAARLAEVAVEHRELLPVQHRRFAAGLRAYLAGAADTAVFHLRAALAIDDQWPEAWMALGEVGYHLLPRGLQEDSAAASFGRAVAVDPGFTPAIIHLAEIAARDGDEERVEELLALLRAHGPGPGMAERIEGMLACLRGGPSGVTWRTDSEEGVALTRQIVRALAASGAQPDCAAEGARRILAGPGRAVGDARSWQATVTLQAILVAQGKELEAERLLDSLRAAGLAQVGLLNLINSAAGLGQDRQAEEFYGFITERYRQSFGDDYYERGTPTTLWALASWLASRGDGGEVRRLADGLARRARIGDRRSGEASRAVEGWARLAEGDTIGAIAVFASLVPSAPPQALAWDLWAAYALERLTLARLYLARGAPADASRVASAFDHPQPVSYIPMLAASLAIRLEAATQTGAAADARVYRARLEELGRDPERTRVLVTPD